MEPITPDPSNSPPEAWLGEATDDSADLVRLATHTVDELAQAVDIDRAEGRL